MRQIPFNLDDQTPSTEAVPQVLPAPRAAAVLPTYDLHTHTVYSGHAGAEATVLNIIKRASELQLSHFGISEHVIRPSDMVSANAIKTEMRSAPASGMQLLFGVEMDINSADRDAGWVVPDVSCDYVILSAHAMPNFDWENDLSPELQRERLATRWLEWFGKAVRRGGFAILGHPLREPIAMNLIDLSDRETLERAVDMLVPAIDHGIAFELNDAFIMALRPSIHYSGYLELLTRLWEKGMKFSRGSDAHAISRVGACGGITHVARELGLAPGDWLDPSAITPRSL